MSPLRTLVFGGGLVLGVAAAAGTASAQTAPCYPNCTLAGSISATVVGPGGSVTGTANGLDAGTTATGTLNSTPVALGTKTVSSSGSVSFTATIPSDFRGAHSLTISGVRNGSAVSVNVPFTVSTGAGSSDEGGGGSETSGTSLARTGTSSSRPLAQGGIALIAVGAGAVYVAKRRRRASASA